MKRRILLTLVLAVAGVVSMMAQTTALVTYEGGYFIKESKAPKGYIQDEKAYYFAITEDAVVVCGENGGAVPLSDLADILKPQYQVK